MKDSSAGNFLRRVIDSPEGTDEHECEEIFWSGLRHQVLARFFMFSHSIFFDATNDSYATVGKLIILLTSLLVV